MTLTKYNSCFHSLFICGIKLGQLGEYSDLMNGVRFLEEARDLSLSLSLSVITHTPWIWGPPSLMLTGCWNLFLQRRRECSMKLTICLHLAIKLGIHGAVIFTLWYVFTAQCLTGHGNNITLFTRKKYILKINTQILQCN
jgi:hypothetical protein